MPARSIHQSFKNEVEVPVEILAIAWHGIRCRVRGDCMAVQARRDQGQHQRVDRQVATTSPSVSGLGLASDASRSGMVIREEKRCAINSLIKSSLLSK